jgi:hypothetical protein
MAPSGEAAKELAKNPPIVAVVQPPTCGQIAQLKPPQGQVISYACGKPVENLLKTLWKTPFSAVL